MDAAHRDGPSRASHDAVLEWPGAAMRILDRYIFREVFSHALLGLAVFTFVFFIPQLVRLMDLVVRHSGGAGRLALLFLSSLPPVLAFTLPMALLVGVLIGLGRLSADSEIVALHALGVGMRRLLLPVGVLALGSSAITLVITIWLGPASLRVLHSLEDQLRSSQVPYALQPRVFDERFPHLVVYVQDVEAAATRWRGVFLAETDSAAGSRLTLAEDAIVVAGPKQGKFELHLGGGSTHEYDPHDPLRYNVSTFGSSDLPIDVTSAADQNSATLSDAERPIGDLLKSRRPNRRESRVELHRRLAFPAACLVFAMLGVSAGVRPRRGGRAAGLVLTLLLICGYYLLFVAGVHLAQQGTLDPAAGVWGANIITAIVALVLLRRIEQIRGQGRISRWWDALAARLKKPATSARAAARPANGTVSNGPITIARNPAAIRSASSNVRTTAFPLLVDLYLLRTFCAYFLLVLGGFVMLFDAFTLFDLLGDISRHHVPVLVVVNYFRYLVPYLVYELTPLAALVAALVTLGILAKNNEVIAFKASGVSLYRLTFPLLLAGAFLAGGMFLLDDTFLPHANQRQDALRNRIKGRPAQTYFQPAHQWIFGEGTRLYNYALFDSDRNLFGGLNVFELDPVTFQMRRRVFADRAKWEPEVNAWILEKGWVRDFDGARITQYVPFKVYALAEMTETPGYFKREVRQYYQMNWRQLRSYIDGLRQAGFDTSRLSVQWHKKFALPLIAAIIVFLSAPFAFLVGTRGAIGGLALAVGIGIVYWATAALCEAMGAVGQLPPLLAAWTPDAVFLFLGAYFFLKMPT
jgi:LPS export ABC transporter permease LptF/LPS export ABC transporter permease LptG